LKRVAVIMGGWSGERPISLLSGVSALKALKDAGWKPKAYDLWPDRPKTAPEEPAPAGVSRLRLSELLPRLRRDRIDVCFLALHGPGGEDGRIQGMLELAGIRFTGSGSRAAAMAMHKRTAKEVFVARSLPTPAWLGLKRGQKSPRFRLPCVLKPVSEGSALGVSIVKKPSHLATAMREAFAYGSEILMERYIEGRELTVAVLGEKALPVVEIIPNKGDFYDYKSKYDKGGSTHLCPAPLSPALRKKAQALALAAHQALGCGGFSRTDIMMDRKNKLWILETNTLPGLTPMSLLPDAARAAGMTYTGLLSEMIRLA
jgi:D-alanine-D-alanine ligase